mmetsp:Transcript_31841/g.105564  ORF Transcript_31841/g.105564 Transcript_31841/m.105564 type:complete len:362 (-) Transcript_31841:434-1519(-)
MAGGEAPEHDEQASKTSAAAQTFAPPERSTPQESTEEAALESRGDGDVAGDTAADAAAEVGDTEEAEVEPEMSWQEIRNRVCPPRGAETDLTPEDFFLQAFEEKYSVDSPVSALFEIKSFLGEYLIQEFNYKDFCSTIGSASAKLLEDDERWSAFVSENLAKDLRRAATVMLRLAVTIAKTFELEAEDWKDVNRACGNAIRAVPACYRLQRELPGALNDARALRHLPVPTYDGTEDLNPWKSEVGRELFEKAHNIEWETIEALTADDSKPVSCFSGTFEVFDVVPLDSFVSVHLKAISAGESPGGFPTKNVQEGDPLVWEVDLSFGSMLDKGYVIEADWYQLESQVCFMSSLTAVAPSWAP